jgi:hypothetical protein
MHWTQIYIPPTLGDVVGVADAVTGLRLFTADITLLRHDYVGSFQMLNRIRYFTGFLIFQTIFHVLIPDFRR